MRSIIKSIIRIIVIFMSIKSLMSFINYGSNIWYNRELSSVEQNSWTELGILLIGFLMAFLVLWILWWKADSLAKLVAGNAIDNKLEIDTHNTGILKVALIFLGVYLLVSSIPDIVG
jgi:hypothetical protein